MVKLTDRFIRTRKAIGKDLFASDGGGLYLRITPAGSRQWVYRYKNAERRTIWLDIGHYPATSLAEARAKATTLKLQRQNGRDPALERQREEEARTAAATAESQRIASLSARLSTRELFERWMAVEISSRSDGGSEIRRMFEKDVLPVIGDIAAEDVRKGHIGIIVDNVLARGGHGRMGAVVLASVRQMFKFGQDRDLVEIDPSATIRKSRIHKPTERDRHLTDDEIRTLVKKLPSAKMCESSQLAVFAMLATCCRIGELSKARISDIDLGEGTWQIPSYNAKNRRMHTVYLSAFAVRVISKLLARAESLGSEWLLPARNRTGSVCEKSLTKQIGDRQRTGSGPMKGRSLLVEALVLPGGKWTPHDLRRTGATLMGDLRVNSDVIERCLNHIEPNRMKRIYQHQTNKDEMRQAWAVLGEHLDRLTEDSDLVGATR